MAAVGVVRIAVAAGSRQGVCEKYFVVCLRVESLAVHKGA